MRSLVLGIAALLFCSTASILLPGASACAEGDRVCVETVGNCMNVGIDPPVAHTWVHYDLCTPPPDYIQVCHVELDPPGCIFDWK